MKNLITLSLLISTFTLGLSLTACNDSKNKGSNREHQQHNHNDNIFACPMHPEETGRKGEKCPKCGMDLVAISNENQKNVEVTLTTEPQVIEAGIPAQLAFHFRENGKNVNLEVSHEMKLHLMVVNKNLNWFRHIHPKEQADGSFTISETFPNGDNYFLFTDFKPQGKHPALDKKEIIVKGASENKNVNFSDNFISFVDGYKVTLENGSDLKTNRSQALEISVEKDGKKLVESDIENYLGATAHIAMISKENLDFLHIHPISEKPFPIYAETHIEKAGKYRIWVEFQTNGKVHTADFTVNVAEGEKSEGDHIHNHY